MANPLSFSIGLTHLGQEEAIRNGINFDDEIFRENKSKHIHDQLPRRK